MTRFLTYEVQNKVAISFFSLRAASLLIACSQASNYIFTFHPKSKHGEF